MNVYRTRNQHYHTKYCSNKNCAYTVNIYMYMKESTTCNILEVPENQKLQLVRNKSGVQSSASTSNAKR